MHVDPFGLSEEEYANNIARCPTCPNDAKYDDKRASKDLFVYYPELGEALYFVDDEGGMATATKMEPPSFISETERHYNGLNDILLGAGLSAAQSSYYDNYRNIKSAYYNLYKTNKSFFPKPGVVNKTLRSARKFLAPVKGGAASKLIRKAGYLGAGLTALKIAQDINNDGMISASSIIDGTQLAIGAAALIYFTPIAPIVGTAILIYGISDYIFDIGGKIDANTNQIKIYDK
jgi:hypothetical protein